MLAYLIVKLNFYLKSRLQEHMKQRWSGNSGNDPHIRKQVFLSLGIFALLALIYLVLIFIVVYGLSRIDPRMQSVFNFNLHQDNPVLRYGRELMVESRLVYWIAGWDVFNDHPWLGVGLGGSGFFFPQKITPFGWNFMEVREVMYRTSEIINVKNLWIRLLAETGIIGFAFFLCWWLMMWKSARVMEQFGSGLARVLGLNAIFVLLGIIVEGFGIDSFALPYFWLSLGMISALFCQSGYNYNVSN